MNIDDENLAYKVRLALLEHMDGLPSSVSDRLEAARKKALARRKPDAVIEAVTVRETVFAGEAGIFSFLGNSTWLQKAAMMLPVLILVFGFAGNWTHRQQALATKAAVIESRVLSDSLPPSAYVDSGFRMYVALDDDDDEDLDSDSDTETV